MTPILRDQQHADHLFNVDQFRLAPKHNFLFHVAFGINKAALGNATLVQRHGDEINMLVKSIDLPSYKIETQTLNQYNRKKNVQYAYKPQEIGITFHDDNLGVINQLWQAYYKYYYADPTTAYTPGAYERNATKAYTSAMPGNYGFDNGSTRPFFNYIKIYQMARREYVLHQLWSPMITNFNHKKVSYADAGVHDFDMKIIYEAVSYDTGSVSAGDPEGFGTSHYDTTPSPLSGGGSGGSGVSGGSFVGQGGINALGGGILNNALNTVNNFQNAAGLVLGGAAVASAIGLGVSLLGKAAGALSGFSFPGAAGTNTSNTQAGTSGTDSANTGDNPASQEEDSFPGGQPPTDPSYKNTSEEEYSGEPTTGENAGVTSATAYNEEAPMGTAANPSPASDGSDPSTWDF